MKRIIIPRFGVFAGLAVLALLFGFWQCPAQYVGPTSGPGSANSIPQAQLIQPDALNHLLQTKGSDKPLVLQVGSHLLFAEAHIAGSEYAGPSSQPAGLQVLQNRVAALSKKQSIVLYCGCCPWNRCPNLGPAFNQLRELGFTNIKVLYIADNLGTNWVDKGYPVERSH
jgi:thiosulfate/3-mercaptopyruvate sulfurtransferase